MHCKVAFDVTPPPHPNAPRPQSELQLPAACCGQGRHYRLVEAMQLAKESETPNAVAQLSLDASLDDKWVLEVARLQIEADTEALCNGVAFFIVVTCVPLMLHNDAFSCCYCQVQFSE